MKRKGGAVALSEAEQAVLAALREGHSESLRFVTSKTASVADAEDVLQEFYLKVIRNARTVRNPGALRTWLSQILRRTLTDYYRSAAVRKKARERLIVQVDDAPMRVDDDAGLAVCRCLYRILPTLRDDEAQLIWRIDLLGQPRKQVAKILEISPNSLGVRLHRARRALRAALERYCITCPTHGFLNCACDEARRTLSKRKRSASTGPPRLKSSARRVSRKRLDDAQKLL